MGYDPLKSATQILGEVRKKQGPILEDASFTLKHFDGTLAEVFGDRALASPGENPTLSDESGYPNPFYRHGDYIAEWSWNNLTHQRHIRIPPVFEDFGMVDVTKFDGVDPTGSTDSRDGINNATTQAIAGGFRLFFPPGNYRADARLNIEPGMHWIGCGMLSRVWAGDANTTTLLGHPTVAGTAPRTDVTIDGIFFDGNQAGRTMSAQSVLRLGYGGVGGDNILIKDCFFKEAPIADLNILIRDCSRVKIWHCIILADGKDGIDVGDCSQVQITDNFVTNCNDDGIAVWNCDGVTVTGNLVHRDNAHNVFGRGIIVGEESRRVTVSGNYVRGALRGSIEINGNVEYVNVVGNLLDSPGDRTTTTWGNGIQYQVPGNVSGSSPAYLSEHVNIVGNVIVNPREHGVFLDPTSTTVVHRIHHVNISENLMVSDGIGNASYKSGLGCGIDAVHVAGNLSKLEHVKIDGNCIYGFDREGIAMTGLAGNTIRNAVIDSNMIFNSGTQALVDSYAIKLDYVDNVKVRNNTGEDTQTVGGQSQLGIFIDHPSGVGHVIGNDMVRSKGGGGNITLNNFGSVSYPAIRDNVGFSPLAGRAVAAATTWTLVSGSVWKRSLNITYPGSVSIATATNPKITAVADQDGWFCTIGTITATTFTVNIFSVVGNPGSQAGTIHWQVEI